MSLKFHNLRISYIVAFDLGLPDDAEINYQLIKETKFLGEYPSFELKSLNAEVYEKEFIRITPKIPTFDLEIRKLKEFKKFIEEIFKENELTLFSSIIDSITKINISFCFDQCQISSARFDFNFNFKYPIRTPTTIKLLNNFMIFVDKILFPKFLKIELETLLRISNDKTKILKEHLTYPIVCSTEIDSIREDDDEYEIFGILWIDEEYRSVSKRTVNQVIKNNIAIDKGDKLIIAIPASLMIFKDTDIDQEYVNEYINAIEIFCRQQHLLKKLDIKLDLLIRKYNTKTQNLKLVIEEIILTQTEIQSSLEFFRNTKISSTHSFKILFDTLNDVFQLDKYYKIVNEKLVVSENLFRSLHEERRNKLTENIQWILVLLGSSALLVAISTLIDSSFLVIILFLILIVILLIIQIKEPGKIKNAISEFINFISK